MSETSETIRLGFVGLRNIGMNHLRIAARLPGITVAAVSDTDDERLDAACAAAEGPVERCGSADDLIADDSIDGVVLAVPNHLHAPMAMAAMSAGKHVLVEKPMAMNPAEGRDMIRVRDATGRVLMPGMNQRFAATHAAAQKKIARGAIGEVQQCHTRWVLDRPFEGLWDRGDWFLSSDTSGGGPLIDLGIHRLDLALYLTGKRRVVSVMGTTTYGVGREIAAKRGKTYELEDYAFGLVQFDDGTMMTVEASYFLNRPGKVRETRVIGTKGAVHLADSAEITSWSGDTAETATLEPDTETATSCVEHFCRVLRNEEGLIPTADEGLLGLAIVDAIYRSAEAGRSVEAMDTVRT